MDSGDIHPTIHSLSRSFHGMSVSNERTTYEFSNAVLSSLNFRTNCCATLLLRSDSSARRRRAAKYTHACSKCLRPKPHPSNPIKQTRKHACTHAQVMKENTQSTDEVKLCHEETVTHRTAPIRGQETYKRTVRLDVCVCACVWVRVRTRARGSRSRAGILQTYLSSTRHARAVRAT